MVHYATIHDHSMSDFIMVSFHIKHSNPLMKCCLCWDLCWWFVSWNLYDKNLCLFSFHFECVLTVRSLLYMCWHIEYLVGCKHKYTQLCIDVKLVSLNSCYFKYTRIAHTLFSFIRMYLCVCFFFISFRFISNKFFSLNQLLSACQEPCTYKLVFII